MREIGGSMGGDRDDARVARKEEGILVLTGLTGWTGFRAGAFSPQRAQSAHRETEENGLEEIARRYLLQPIGGFPPEDREGWGRGKVSNNVNRQF